MYLYCIWAEVWESSVKPQTTPCTRDEFEVLCHSPGLFPGGSGVCGGVYPVSGGRVSQGTGSVGCDHVWVE